MILLYEMCVEEEEEEGWRRRKRIKESSILEACIYRQGQGGGKIYAPAERGKRQGKTAMQGKALCI